MKPVVCRVCSGNFVKFGSSCVEISLTLKALRLRESEDTAKGCRDGLRKQMRTKRAAQDHEDEPGQGSR